MTKDDKKVKELLTKKGWNQEDLFSALSLVSEGLNRDMFDKVMSNVEENGIISFPNAPLAALNIARSYGYVIGEWALLV